MCGRLDLAGQLELFFGRVSDATARVYAQLRAEEFAGLHLSGTLTGPHCQYANTLPVRFKFVDRGPGKSLLAEAVVPEPCFWTPDMPHRYDADVELRRGGEVVARMTSVFGLRPLGAAAGKLFYQGKRWVLRAVARGEVPPTDLSAWREASAAMFVRNPTDELCSDASRVGVLVVAELEKPDVDQIRRLSRWPAVGIVVLPAEKGLIPLLAGLRHNLLLAQRFAADQSVAPAPWAHVALVEVDGGTLGDLAGRLGNCTAAIIPMRSGGAYASVAAARAECDNLQRDLAGVRDWAGYIV